MMIVSTIEQCSWRRGYIGFLGSLGNDTTIYCRLVCDSRRGTHDFSATRQERGVGAFLWWLIGS